MSQETQLLIFYDISNNKLRTTIHHFLRDYGLNSQKSLFEVQCSHAERENILRFLQKHTPPGPDDSIRVYEVCRRCLHKCECVGNSPGLDFKPYEIV
jgi:CRISPR-associated protein Cas2